MKLIGIRTPKPREFSYKPLYYNPVKEAQENRLKDQDIKDGAPGSELRMRLRLRMNREKLDERIRKRSRMMSNLFTLVLLLLVQNYIFFK